MKIFTLCCFAALVFSFSSCTTYQYLTLASDGTSLDKEKRFILDTDTVRVTYDFKGKNGQLTLHIFNKSNLPLEIDWKRSALIVGDKPVSFFRPGIEINGDVSRTPLTTTSATFNGQLSQEAGVEFIPPQTTIRRTGFSLNPGIIKMAESSKVEKKIKGDRGAAKKIEQASFSNETSPFRARVYLSFSIPAHKNQFYQVDKAFYLSELMQTEAAPQHVLTGGGNQFYVDKTPKGTKGTVMLLGLTGLLVIAAGAN